MTLKTSLIAAGALIAASAATISTAQASNVNFGFYLGGPQGGVYLGHTEPRHHRHHRDWRHQILPEWTIRDRLHRQGYRDIRGLDLHSRVYAATATGYRGAVYRVTVNAFTGQVINQYVVDWPRYRGHGGWAR